jgi:SAM-dependent methyltransferase
MPFGGRLRGLGRLRGSAEGRREPTRRPRALPGKENPEIGEFYLGKFVALGDLKPNEAVLEPGCGAGRMAEPLTRYLSEEGSYDGFDIVADAIEWCRKNIASRHPNFRFRHVDVRNLAYNRDGRLAAEEFEFPYPAETFDFTFLTSVFTHMLPPAVRNYLGEIRRTLRPGGRCLMTFFVLNDASLAAAREGRATRKFAHQGDGYFFDLPQNPESAIAYREEDLHEFLQQAGLELHRPIDYGYWTGPRGPDAPGQDVVVVKRSGP